MRPLLFLAHISMSMSRIKLKTLGAASLRRGAQTSVEIFASEPLVAENLRLLKEDLMFRLNGRLLIVTQTKGERAWGIAVIFHTLPEDGRPERRQIVGNFLPERATIIHELLLTPFVLIVSVMANS
jgi:hypothetical protein